jgi:molybdopterin converting factor small subunit
LEGERKKMSIKVRVPTALTKGANGSDTVEMTAQDLSELLSGLEQRYPGVRKSLCDEAGKLNRFVNVFVNDEDIRFLGGEKYHFQDGDEVLLIPSIAGG